MPFIAGGAILGGIGGLFKSGPDLNMEGRKGAADALAAFRNLTAKGPGEQDVTASLEASRGFANQLNNLSTGGLYNMGEGRRLSEMQFAPQRQALAQSLQDQMAQANRAAAGSGRSSNDPILRARLGAQAMRENAALSAQQNAAAMDLGRQSSMDMLSLQGQRVNTLGALSAQAFANQQGLFDMNQNLFNMDLGAAGYENSRGGGIKGMFSGMLTGAGAGMGIATGLGNMANANTLTSAQANLANSLAKSAPAVAAGMMAPPPVSAPRIGPSSLGALGIPQVSAPRIGPSSLSALGIQPVQNLAPSRSSSVFGPNSMLWK